MGQIADVCILRKDLCKQIALHSAGSGAGETCRLLTGGLSGVLSFGGTFGSAQDLHFHKKRVIIHPSVR